VAAERAGRRKAGAVFVAGGAYARPGALGRALRAIP